ncbi:uncharacterized protein [Cicer arietinum]|uniref:uncharacterized protein n=1 Tax=Cicer arietinum TaxID=3827 RepID=UPI00032ABFE9
MASQSETKSIFTNYITSPLSVEKLNGSNYDSWAADIKLWLRGQGYEDHLTQNLDKVSVTETSKWSQIDAQLCSVIKSTLHPYVKPIFRPHLTCESVWSQAKALYTNDTQHLYGVSHRLLNIITPKSLDGSISAYVGTVHSALHDFNGLLPLVASNPAKQKKELDQRNTFFMLLALYGLPQEYFATLDQILGSVTVLDMSTTSGILLRVPAKHPVEQSITSIPGDIAALASQGHNQHRSRGGPSNSKPRLKCEHCHRVGHTIDRCWKLHGKPLPSINATQHDPSAIIQTTPSPQDSPTNYEDFLRWVQSHPNSSSTSVAHTGNSSVYLSQSSSLGPWVLDSGASDHVTGNKGLFSSLSTSGFLPTVTSANGTQTRSQGVGTVHILPSISVAFVLYDRNSGRTIGVGCESQGLYYLSTSSKTCSATESPHTIHAQLGHSSLTKLQKLVAERKNRHLIETTRTLLLHGNVPFRFWGDAVLTACYLINRMPSSVLDDKLSARSLKCVFLGYHRSQKGYRCYSPTLHRYVTSVGVTFFESVQYFKPTHIATEPYHDITPEPPQLVIPLPPIHIPTEPAESAPQLPRPLQTYQHRCLSSVVFVPVPIIDSPLTPPPDPALPPEPDLPIALRKDIRTTRNPSPHYIDLCYHRLSPLHCTCLSTLSSSPRAWFGRFSSVVQEFGMIRSEADHSVFYHHSAQRCIYLIVYVDDIVITGSDQQGILQLKQHLSNKFQTKYLGKLRYFLGIEVAQSKDDLVISQRKYAMDILEETCLLKAKSVDTPMDPNVKLLPNQGDPNVRFRKI